MHYGKISTISGVAMALALALSAGSATALVQDGTGVRGVQRADQPQTKPERRAVVDHNVQTRFVRSDAFLGADLENRAGESLGSIENAVVDRGSGRLVFVIVKTGDFLGIGGKSIALPYRELSYGLNDGTFSADLTPEQLEGKAEFLPENWTDLTTSDWMDDFGDWLTGDDAATREAKIAVAASEQDGRPIEGQIVAIDRNGIGDAEDTVVTVLTESNERFEVVLGPSWFVLGGDHAPYRGDVIEIVALDVDGVWYATETRLDGKELRLRDRDGSARWSTSVDKQTPRYFLLTDLIGRSVEIDGSTSGEIQSGVIETGSGSLAFIGLDPNENFLGLADKIVLTPWSVIRVNSALGVSLDAPATAIDGAMEMPSDLKDLQSRARLERAYSAFDVRPARFERSRSAEHDQTPERSRDGALRSGDTRSAWGEDSTIVTACAKGRKIEFGVTVREQTTEKMSGDAGEAWVLTVDTEAGDQRRVIVGPSWYMSRQPASFQPGDFVVVQGRSASLDGEEWVGAWLIKHGDKTYTYWNGDKPVWIE